MFGADVVVAAATATPRHTPHMYVSALHHLGSLFSEMNKAEMAYSILHKAAVMRPDRKDISCSLFMAQRRYGIWNVRAASRPLAVRLLQTVTFALGLRRDGRSCG